jgi:hypothetical protein
MRLISRQPLWEIPYGQRKKDAPAWLTKDYFGTCQGIEREKYRCALSESSLPYGCLRIKACWRPGASGTWIETDTWS